MLTSVASDTLVTSTLSIIKEMSINSNLLISGTFENKDYLVQLCLFLLSIMAGTVHSARISIGNLRKMILYHLFDPSSGLDNTKKLLDHVSQLVVY
jgi:hypothetical protein